MSDPLQQQLPETLSKFTVALSELWDELGMENSVRMMHLNDVLRQVSTVLSDRVRQERNVRDSTRRSIESSASKIIHLSKQLGLKVEEAQRFVDEQLGSHVPLFQSRDTLSREQEQLLANRSQLVAELIDVLQHLFSMEADLGESTGALELFSELQSRSFDETQANTFRNDPSYMDCDTLLEIPLTVERMRELMVDAHAQCEARRLTLAQLDESIENLCQDVQEDRQAFRNASLYQHPELSLKRIEAVEAIKAQLVALRDRRGHILHDYANRLKIVWDQLGVSSEERTAFINRNIGRSMQVINACEDELARVTVLKTAKVRELVLQLRDRIRAAWDDLSVPQIERKLFEDRYDYESETNFSDETLEVHKTLANNLEELVILSKPLKLKIDEYEALLAARERYIKLTQNGDRLRDRKYSMTVELALSRKVATIPKLHDFLLQELAKWKEQNRNQPLLIRGEDYLARMSPRKGTNNRKPSGPLTSNNSHSPHLTTNPVAAPSRPSAMTPNRPQGNIARTLSAAPATTGRAVSTRPRTNTADGTKSISAKARPSENSNNK